AARRSRDPGPGAAPGGGGAQCLPRVLRARSGDHAEAGRRPPHPRLARSRRARALRSAGPLARLRARLPALAAADAADERHRRRRAILCGGAGDHMSTTVERMVAKTTAMLRLQDEMNCRVDPDWLA